MTPLVPRTGRRQAALDALLALVLSPLVLAGLHRGSGPLHASTSLVLAGALSLLATWSLALRRRHPVAVLSVVVAAGLLLDLALGGNSGALVPQIAVAVYTLALGRSWRTASVVAAVTALSFIVSAAVALDDLSIGNVVSRAAVIGGATAVGLYVATRRAYVEALQQRNLHLERERTLLSQQAVAEERVRIARELHDVVAHHVSLLVVQAGGVRESLGPDHPARPVLDSMASTGRQALDEMRRMLGLLRVGEMGATPDLAPQPGLGDIETLVAQTRAAGLPIELSVEGDPRPLPVGVDLSAYRIVQEALTNVIKHAGPARVRVALRHREHSLEIEVLDNGRGNLGAPRPAGHGLVGMRERVAIFGGELVAGPAPRGGFAVHASLPIDGPPPVSAIRVLLVDDQALMRGGFRMILEAQPDITVVGEAGDGLEAVVEAERLSPDVVIMDIRMPRCDGVEATRRLPGHRVLILTTFHHDEYVVDALRAGASGFLLKDATPEELVNAVRVVAAGDALLAPSVTRQLLDHVVTRLRDPARPQHAALAELTERELEVLGLLARGLSNAEIAASLNVTEATVKTHVSHVLDKLGLRDRVQAVVLAYELGLVNPGGLSAEGTTQ